MNTHNKVVRQNLVDAGCDENTIERFFDSMTKDDRLRVLSDQRYRLLEEYHNDAKKLDCLDYLINQLKKEETE